MEIISAIFYFILIIGVLVLVHEWGHFAAAKLTKMRVERFSIGFPPRAFGIKIGETDYCISWIPIGGYVKISGMIDESFDTEHLSRPPEPWEFRSKPMVHRMFVITAGVLMNILLAIGIFWGLNFFEGQEVWPTTEIGFVAENSPAAKAGLKTGDKVLSVNGAVVKYWDEIESSIYVENMGRDIILSVDRLGQTLELSVSRSEIPSIEETRFGILPKNVAAGVGTVEEGKPAQLIGLKTGDLILSVNREPVDFYTIRETIKKYTSKEVEIEWRRNGRVEKARVTPTDEGRIGISLRPHYLGPVERMKFSFFGALVQGVKNLVDSMRGFFINIRAIIQGNVSLSESVGGPVRIAQIATQSAQAGAASFLRVMAWLSMTLALLNILPFPALDGGHLMFLVYEGVFRREIPAKVKMALQQVGFTLLLVFMAFVLYNDIVNF